MPIKFRCRYCQQLLGIARSKAGSTVDCPACGRTLRVPDTEGKVPEPRQPKLDLSDNSLREALDELAAIGDWPEDEESASPPEELELAPLPAPPVFEASVTEPPVVAQSRRVPVPEPEETDSNDDAILAELAAKAAQTSDRKPTADRERVTDSNTAGPSPAENRQPRLALLAGALLLGGFLLGFLCGRWTAPASPPRPAEQVAADHPPARQPPDANAAEAEAKPRLEFHVTFTTSGDAHRPDRGALVLALPKGMQLAKKLSSHSVRPGMSSSDLDSAATVLQQAGGGISLVDETGQARLNLPQPGEYSLIVISRFHGRAENESIPQPVQELLATCFDDVEALVGRRSVSLQSAAVTSQGAQFEQSFPAS